MSPRLLSLLLSAAVVLTAAVVGLSVALVPVRTGSGHPARPVVAAAEVLGDWDGSRARAWAAGDPGALRDLYVAGSSAGRADRTMLRAWSARGLRVVGLRMQLLAVDVVVASADRLVLDVTDRLVGGVAVGSGVPVPLPRDAATSHRVTLVRQSGEWRVAEVRPGRSAAPRGRSGRGTRSRPAGGRRGAG